jgi:hypothetical protein
MWKRLTAAVLALAVPGSASAGPLRDAIDKAGREIVVEQVDQPQSRARFWSGIALIAGGGVMTALGGIEIGDDEVGPDDGEDFDNSDDGEDSDGWNKGLLGGGIAAATLGGVLLLTGRKKSGPVVSMTPGQVSVRQTIRF